MFLNPPLFEQECPRLLAALGAITNGGVIESIQPIGSSSVPGLTGSGRVDIGMSIWPFPVNEAVLDGLGYHPVSAQDTADIQRFEDASGQMQLWLVKADNSFWEHTLLIRDYLRHGEAARQEFMAARRNPVEKAEFFRRILPEAEQWWVTHNGFTPLETITAEFRGLEERSPAEFPWYVSSGWALDLFLGRVTRVHRDVDIVIPFSQQMALQTRLLDHGWQLLTPLDGRLEPWPRHMQIQLPRFQIHAHRDGAFIDLLLTEIEHGIWHYRRDPVIIRSVERIGLKSAGGIPYLAPELVLLFKSKNTGTVERPQDQADFEQALHLLEPERRAWLRWAILATDTEHAWLKLL